MLPSPGPAPAPTVCSSFSGALCPVPGVWPVRRAWEGRARGKAAWVARAGCVFARCLGVETGWWFWTEGPGEVVGFLRLPSDVLAPEPQMIVAAECPPHLLAVSWASITFPPSPPMLALGDPLCRPGGGGSEGQRPLRATWPTVSPAWEFAGSTASLPSLPWPCSLPRRVVKLWLRQHSARSWW